MCEVNVITWIDVADSAVKIGLGALIGWLATYSTARLTQKHEIAKEQRARRRELVEGVATQIESYFVQIYTAFAYIQARHKEIESSGSVSESFLKKYKEAIEPLGTSIDLAEGAEAKLLLLEQTECAKKVRELYQLSDKYTQTLLHSYDGAKNFPINELEKIAGQIRNIPRDLLNELAKSYDKF